jgi:ABC-type uncharacterized transport system permease subunit
MRRERILGGVLVAVSALILVFFAGIEGGQTSRFGLSTGAEAISLPALALPSRGTIWALAIMVAALGGVLLARGFGWRATSGTDEDGAGSGRRGYLVLGVGLALFVVAFLVWAARGAEFSLIGLLQSTLVQATPLALGALAGLLCERSGVVNIAIEGQMLAAAFLGALIGSAAGSLVVGLLAALLGGAVLAWALAALSIRYKVDQIIAGTVINIFALGMTSYLSALVFSRYLELNNPGRFPTLTIPILADIPIIGPLLFTNSVFVYALFALVLGIRFALARTRWGLRTRAAGEHPRAADTVGIDPQHIRYLNVALGGAIAGLAGAYFTLGAIGRFSENMTAGAGFIALAALIFGRWTALGAFGAALVFGFFDSLQTKLAILDVPIPSQFLLMAPYIATILAVAGLVGRSRPPAAVGKPYDASR